MPLSRKRAWLRAPALSFAPSILMDMSDPTACCGDCGTPREIPVDGEKTCAVCGSPNVSLRDSDEATMHELVALKARDDEPEMSEPVVACKNCGAELNESASAPSRIASLARSAARSDGTSHSRWKGRSPSVRVLGSRPRAEEEANRSWS
jgi:uncharacterized Zn finger protein (UPF0148 family)